MIEKRAVGIFVQKSNKKNIRGHYALNVTLISNEIPSRGKKPMNIEIHFNTEFAHLNNRYHKLHARSWGEKQ